ncbi:hypothetical protein BJ165DRAFT_1501866 [Panaeolus papilionaceus]|nr:hypothetical protein BJ165DRAFT_1501866 [Panaeolus papilionaceus]
MYGDEFPAENADSRDPVIQLHQSPNEIVPNDIWSEVFYRVCQDSLAEYRKSDREASIPLSPFTLSHVCRHWYDLATSLPILWTNLFVFEHTKSPYSLLTTSLQRTGSSTLSIWIVAKDCGTFDIPNFAACLKALGAVCDRWKSLSLALGDTGKAEASRFFNESDNMDTSTNDFSSLEYVESTLPAGDRIPRVSDEYHFLQYVFNHRPTFKPCTIRLSSWYPIYADVARTNQPDPSMIWTSVTSLVFHRQHLTNTHLLFMHLSMMPKLQSLEVNTCFILPTYHPPRNRAALENLTKLAIYNTDDSLAVETIFSHLLVPKLENVDMTPNFHFRGFRKMAETSQCSVRQLSITIKDTKSFNELFFLLASPTFQSLHELTICGKVLDQECVEALEIPPPVTFESEDLYQPVLVSSAKPLPNTNGLTHLTLLGCSTPDGQLGDLAKGRKEHGSLCYFYVETNESVEDKHREDSGVFRELQQLGFEAYLHRTCRVIQ